MYLLTAMMIMSCNKEEKSETFIISDLSLSSILTGAGWMDKNKTIISLKVTDVGYLEVTLGSK